MKTNLKDSIRKNNCVVGIILQKSWLFHSNHRAVVNCSISENVLFYFAFNVNTLPVFRLYKKDYEY